MYTTAIRSVMCCKIPPAHCLQSAWIMGVPYNPPVRLRVGITFGADQQHARMPVQANAQNTRRYRAGFPRYNGGIRSERIAEYTHAVRCHVIGAGDEHVCIVVQDTHAIGFGSPQAKVTRTVAFITQLELKKTGCL